jgi:hypothetical protein
MRLNWQIVLEMQEKNESFWLSFRESTGKEKRAFSGIYSAHLSFWTNPAIKQAVA